jgi:hypothetical protein
MVKLLHLRRSTRNGRRSSTRIKPKKIRKKKETKVQDLYDRDLGGYKFVAVHKNKKWHQTKRSKRQLREEEILCEKLRKNSATISNDGYAIDHFFVEHDTGESTLPEDTDRLFAKADRLFAKADKLDYNSDDSDDSDSEWSESD